MNARRGGNMRAAAVKCSELLTGVLVESLPLAPVRIMHILNRHTSSSERLCPTMSHCVPPLPTRTVLLGRRVQPAFLFNQKTHPHHASGGVRLLQGRRLLASQKQVYTAPLSLPLARHHSPPTPPSSPSSSSLLQLGGYLGNRRLYHDVTKQ